ncbi:outer membrane lipoprotein-sorting protein [Acidicapsa dinghuensis]|uniref:Outer membrane lipoprotein-sorting protein n=1 Tax=Acidicapsa dinghuensis TaxID=2218256 RepID=A0ABW1EGQ6_9BACT|nr:outer membrane lipoprotein-sorting protein [Acidicapsa dinghuensis]
MKRWGLAAFLVMAACALSAQAPDARAVLAKAKQRTEAADFRAVGRLVRVDAKGARSNMPVTIKGHWFSDGLKVLAEIGSSGPARVHVLLEMRPEGQITIREARPGDKAASAVPFERWSESPVRKWNTSGTTAGYSYEDLLEAQYFWPGQTVEKETRYGARDCEVLKSVPGAGQRSHYASVQSWLDRGIGFPVYVEKSLKANGPTKEFTYFGLRQTEGVWSASQIEVKIRGQAGSSLLIVDRGSPKAKLGAGDFSTAELTHF